MTKLTRILVNLTGIFITISPWTICGITPGLFIIVNKCARIIRFAFVGCWELANLWFLTIDPWCIISITRDHRTCTAPRNAPITISCTLIVNFPVVWEGKVAHGRLIIFSSACSYTCRFNLKFACLSLCKSSFVKNLDKRM